MLLQDLLNNLTLLEADRIGLYGRGFTDETITQYQLKSCQPLNAFILDDFFQKYGLEALLKEQIYETDPHHQGLYVAQWQLLQSGILIPYFKQNGDILKIRPHKLGFQGQGARVFRTFSSFNQIPSCIIAESEFKAIAAECFGFAAIGIPGISSMSGKNWDYFSKELESINAREFVICFDNEIKDNIDNANFKADWRKRYDTIIYAYAMAQKILNLGKTCRIATLPVEWMVDGKIDIDGALGQKRTLAEFAKVIAGALGPKGFLDNAPIPQKHRGFVNRRVRRFFYVPQVDVKQNCYFSLSGVNEKGEEIKGNKLSNCVVHIQNVYEELGTETEGLLRDLVITDEYGVESKPISSKAASMASKGAFKEWLMSQGNYLFYGNEQDLTKIWEHVFNNDDGSVVYLLNRCGYIREFDFYIFKNVLIKNGQPIYPDEAGIFWSEQVGYKPQVIHEECPLPSLATEGSFDLKRFLSLLADTTDYGSPGMAKALMGWLCAVHFIDAIQDAYKLFPLLFVYGAKGGGKTTVLRWLASFFGQERATFNMSISSSVGLTRGLDYYSSLPFVADDWRNLPKFNHYIPLFLGVYNRQGGIKGIKAKFGLQVSSVRAALVIMGEELINDNAVMSRCLAFYMPETRIKECSEEVEAMLPMASTFTFNVLTNNFEAKKKEVLANIREYARELKRDAPGLSARVAINYAVIGGAYKALIGEDAELTSYLDSMVGISNKMSREGDKLHQFAEEFLVCTSNFEVQPQHYAFEGDKLFLWMKGVCDCIDKYYGRRGNDSSQLLIQHFSKQSYYVATAFRSFRADMGEVPCAILSLEKMPDSLRRIFEGAKSADSTPGARPPEGHLSISKTG